MTEISSNNEQFPIDKLHMNLVLLSKIQSGDKLTFNSNVLNIDRSYLQGIWRWYNSCDRQKTIQYINTIIEQTFKAIDLIIVDESYMTLSSETRDMILQRFNIELKNSINGLINLKATYMYDNSIVAAIDVIIENINTKINILNGLLKISN